MTVWCDNCGMGKDCIGYTKLPHKDCALYLHKRMDGSILLTYTTENTKDE